MPNFSDAQKAALLALVNTLMGLAIAFGIHLTLVQAGAIASVVNSAAVFYIVMTTHLTPQARELRQLRDQVMDIAMKYSLSTPRPRVETYGVRRDPPPAAG